MGLFHNRLNSVTALQIFFVTQSLGLSLWLLRIPEVKSKIGLNLIELSLALFMQPFGVLIGFFIAPYLITKIGNRNSCRYFGSTFIAIFMLIPMAKTFIFLSTILFISGVVCATVEVSMNALAAQVEEDLKTRMMSKFHAFWSIGALISGALVTLMSLLEISFLNQQFLIIPILLALVVFVAKDLPIYHSSQTEPKSNTVSGLTPKLSLVILCITPFGALLLEGALMESTAVFKRDYQNLPELTVGLIFCSFTITMTLARFFGDQVIDRFGINKTILISISFSLMGMIIYAQNNTAILSIIGASLVGAGIANIYPLTITLTASLPGLQEKNVASVAFISFTAFLIGAPLIGIVGEYLGLETALSIIAPASLLPLIYLLHKHLENKID